MSEQVEGAAAPEGPSPEGAAGLVGGPATEDAATPEAPASPVTPEAPATATPEASDAVTLAEADEAEASAEAADSEAPATPEGAQTAEATESETPAAPVPAEPAEAPEPPVVRRQSLSLRDGVCDMRVGAGCAGKFGVDLRGIIGKPRRALLALADDVPAELAERVRRTLVDVGFDVSEATVPHGAAARTLEAATSLYPALAAAGITADDALVCVGDADVLSALVFVAGTWCGGCVLAGVPTSLDGAMDVSVTPRSLDAAGEAAMVRARGTVRLLVCDPDVCDWTSGSERVLMGRAVMVAGAVTAGEHSFSELGVRADGIVSGDVATISDAVMDLTKARCRIASSSAVAIRQGMGYGLVVARVLRTCLAEASAGEAALPGDARLLAEGLRISARLAAAHDGPETSLVDLVFAQDGLLERLGLAEVPCDLDPDALLGALKAETLRRSNRNMLAVPLDYGRVRLVHFEDDLLAAHLRGWCKARRRLMRKLAASRG